MAEDARPLGPQTAFEIGSNTKVFTGTLLSDMTRRGEVSLSDPVAHHPESSITPVQLAILALSMLALMFAAWRWSHRSA